MSTRDRVKQLRSHLDRCSHQTALKVKTLSALCGPTPKAIMFSSPGPPFSQEESYVRRRTARPQG